MHCVFYLAFVGISFRVHEVWNANIFLCIIRLPLEMEWKSEMRCVVHAYAVAVTVIIEGWWMEPRAQGDSTKNCDICATAEETYTNNNFPSKVLLECKKGWHFPDFLLILLLQSVVMSQVCCL
jgi:hypothetical protein